MQKFGDAMVYRVPEEGPAYYHGDIVVKDRGFTEDFRSEACGES